MFKSRSLRRVFRRTPGKRLALQYRPRKPGKAHCAKCGRELLGVPAKKRIALARVPKAKRRPERMFGGVLCSSCTRDYLKQQARKGMSAEVASA